MCKKIENHSLRRYRKKGDWQRGRGGWGWSGEGGRKGGKNEEEEEEEDRKQIAKLLNSLCIMLESEFL